MNVHRLSLNELLLSLLYFIKARDNLNRKKFILLFMFMFAFIVTMYINASRPSPITMNPILMGTISELPTVKKPNWILVLYVWADTDVQAVGNLHFFVNHGVRATQPIDYYFILQNVDDKRVDESRLPPLPPNGHYIQHENKCMDIGSMGWFFAQNIANLTIYKYFFFMNSSIRGPFFPPYFEFLKISWFEIFTTRLTDEIKLFGPSISCEQRPHVQSYLMVTDPIGLALLRGNQTGIFNCHANYHDAVFNGEIAASQLLLHANYQIASLQSKYQGWDFRKPENGGCNFGASPIYYDKGIDEINHDPFELVFVKFKGNPPFDTEIERRALVYKKWLDERPRRPGNNSTNTTNIG